MRQHLSESLISIIIPIYNTCTTLPRCVESVLQQTYSSLEVILVDDGSTDNSSDICKRYQNRDHRVRVIHKENGGNTSARKAGVEIANGDYIGFVDSDDWIEPEMYETLVYYAKRFDADIVSTGYYIENGKSVSRILDGIPCGIYEKEKNYDALIRNLVFVEESEIRGLSMSLCNKIMKKSTLIYGMNQLSNDIQILEDAICVYKAVMNANRVYLSNDCFYHYCMRTGSILHSKDEDYFIKINQAYKELKKEVQCYPAYLNFLMPQLGKLMADYLIKGINYFFDFGIKVSIPYYLCPLGMIPSGSKIVLYGAGKLGRSYYEQLGENKTYTLVAWIDQNAMEKQSEGLEVLPLEALYSIEYDFVLLGAQKSGIAENMKNTLIKMGVEGKKIVWQEPESIVRIGKV